MNTTHTARLAKLHDQHGERSLTVLTILLVLMLFVVSPLHASGFFASEVFGVICALFMLVGVLIVSGSPLAFGTLLAAFAMNIAAIILRLMRGPSMFDVFLMATAWLLIGVTLAWVVGRAVFGPGRVTYHRIVGAVLLYLLIAQIFVSLFVFVSLLNPKAISGTELHDDPAFYSSIIYFSFVTLTSTGYGDIVPVHPIVRALCNLETIVGQLYPATLLARLVSLEIASRPTK